MNWHQSPEVVAYVVDNCDAKALVASGRFAVGASEAAKAGIDEATARDVARCIARARGVVAVLAGQVHAADRVRKVHTYRTGGVGVLKKCVVAMVVSVIAVFIPLALAVFAGSRQVGLRVHHSKDRCPLSSP